MAGAWGAGHRDSGSLGNVGSRGSSVVRHGGKYAADYSALGTGPSKLDTNRDHSGASGVARRRGRQGRGPNRTARAAQAGPCRCASKAVYHGGSLPT